MNKSDKTIKNEVLVVTFKIKDNSHVKVGTRAEIARSFGVYPSESNSLLASLIKDSLNLKETPNVTRKNKNFKIADSANTIIL